jgi:hypothetical protein
LDPAPFLTGGEAPALLAVVEDVGQAVGRVFQQGPTEHDENAGLGLDEGDRAQTGEEAAPSGATASISLSRLLSISTPPLGLEEGGIFR